MAFASAAPWGETKLNDWLVSEVIKDPTEQPKRAMSWQAMKDILMAFTKRTGGTIIEKTTSEK